MPGVHSRCLGARGVAADQHRRCSAAQGCGLQPLRPPPYLSVIDNALRCRIRARPRGARHSRLCMAIIDHLRPALDRQSPRPFAGDRFRRRRLLSFGMHSPRLWRRWRRWLFVRLQMRRRRKSLRALELAAGLLRTGLHRGSQLIDTFVRLERSGLFARRIVLLEIGRRHDHRVPPAARSHRPLAPTPTPSYRR